MAEMIAEVKDVAVVDIEAEATEFYICKASEFGFDMHTKSGKTIEFRAFQHVTASLEVAKYLEQCIKDRIKPLLSLKKVSKDELDPLHEVRQKIIAEYKAAEQVAMHGARDDGSIEKQFGMAYSTDVAQKTSAQEHIDAALAAKKVNS